MEWKLTFTGPEHCDETKLCWSHMTMPVKHPLRPIYGENSMTIRNKEIQPTYQLPHLYRYWKQEVRDHKEMKSEVSYQLDRPSDFLKKMWPSGLYSDVTLAAGDQKFRVHRAVLGLSSSFMKFVFESVEKDEEIDLSKDDPAVLSQFLFLIYGYRVVLSGLQGLRLLNMVRLFGVDEVSFREIEEMIKMLEIKEEESLEFVELMEEIYKGKDPDWYGYFFNYITPKEKSAFERLFSQLPEPLEDFFRANYDLS